MNAARREAVESDAKRDRKEAGLPKMDIPASDVTTPKAKQTDRFLTSPPGQKRKTYEV